MRNPLEIESIPNSRNSDSGEPFSIPDSRGFQRKMNSQGIINSTEFPENSEFRNFCNPEFPSGIPSNPNTYIYGM
jgi:hypothetical protein